MRLNDSTSTRANTLQRSTRRAMSTLDAQLDLLAPEINTILEEFEASEDGGQLQAKVRLVLKWGTKVDNHTNQTKHIRRQIYVLRVYRIADGGDWRRILSTFVSQGHVCFRPASRLITSTPC